MANKSTFFVAAPARNDVERAAAVKLVIVHPVCPLICRRQNLALHIENSMIGHGRGCGECDGKRTGMGVARQDDIHPILVQKGLEGVLHALSLTVVIDGRRVPA